MRSIFERKSKKGMTQAVVGIAFGIVTLALLVGVGSVVLTKFGNSAGPGAANDSVVYLIGQLGSSGLAGWVPAIIALAIGVMFISYFAGRKKGY